VDGLSLAYNLDHEQALVLLRRAVALAPSDSAPHRALASVLWLNILFRRGTVTVDHYLGALTRSSIDLPKPPADIDAELKDHIQRAIALAEIQVSAHPKDAQAHYDLGAALGLQASYVATIEGRMLAGFRAARRSFDEEEQVLALDPSRSEAGLIIGTYRYVVSTLSLPMRMMAYVAGFGGGRASAIQMLQRTAETGSGTAGLDAQRNARAGVGNDARTDAMFALVLVYNRERQYNEAFRVLQDLRRLYPRNRLLLLEAGATQLRAGHAQQADDLLSEGLTMLARDQRARIPGEESLWRYKRGAARAALGRLDLAVADLQTATAAGAPLWVSGRARVELGRLALTRGDPVQAAANARQAEASCERGNDPECVRQAHALLRSTLGR
jgi:tetratricopeptide (TPR) repeat protein